MASIRIIKYWNGYSPDTIVDFGETENSRLVNLGYASSDLDGANDGQEVGVFAKRDPVTGRIRNAQAGNAQLPIVFQHGGITPYRLATFGDSRANNGSHRSTVSPAVIGSEKVPGQLCMIRGDMEIVFNGGISGDTAVNWNSASRVSSSQTVKDLIASSPDLVYVQYGINDLIAGTAGTVIVAALQSLLSKIIGAGIPVVFESVNPAAASAASYINGYSSTGGYGASAASKLAETQYVNSTMQAWIAQFPANVALFVDTSSVSTGADGYAKTDQTYYDGTHMSRKGTRPAAKLIDAAIAEYFPRRYGQFFKAAYPNGLNRCWLSPTSGRASGVSTPQNEFGTCTATYQIVTDEDGDLCQEVLITSTVLSSGAFRTRIDLTPDWIGASPFFAIAPGDVLQAAVDYCVDNGSGGAPLGVFAVYARARIFYDDSTSEYTTHGEVVQSGSTDYPSIPEAEAGRLICPRLAQKAAMGSSHMTTSTALQIIVVGNALTTFRLRIKNPQWLRVA